MVKMDLQKLLISLFQKLQLTQIGWSCYLAKIATMFSKVCIVALIFKHLNTHVLYLSNIDLVFHLAPCCLVCLRSTSLELSCSGAVFGWSWYILLELGCQLDCMGSLSFGGNCVSSLFLPLQGLIGKTDSRQEKKNCKWHYCRMWISVLM